MKQSDFPLILLLQNSRPFNTQNQSKPNLSFYPTGKKFIFGITNIGQNKKWLLSIPNATLRKSKTFALNKNRYRSYQSPKDTLKAANGARLVHIKKKQYTSWIRPSRAVNAKCFWLWQQARVKPTPSRSISNGFLTRES